MASDGKVRRGQPRSSPVATVLEFRPASATSPSVRIMSTQQQRRTSLSEEFETDDEIPALQSPSDSSESEDEPTPQPQPTTRQRTAPLRRPLALDSDDSDIDITESGTVLSFFDSRSR